MSAQPGTTVVRSESRIFPILLSLGFLVLVETMPSRFEILPRAVAQGLEVILVGSMIVAALSPPTSVWGKIERWVIFVVSAFALVLELGVLRELILDIVNHSKHFSAITLLATSISVWVINLLVFSLIYWQMDRGGPAGRATGWTGRADFSFPLGNPDDGVPADWKPGFVDYFSLAFDTSTAFSPTDSPPLTPRAKLFMIAQSTISLVTIVVVAARAINILT
jgi:hypothetical protein